MSVDELPPPQPHGEGVPYHQGVSLADRLTSLGVVNALVPVPGAGHLFEGATDLGALVEAGLDFVERVWASG